MRLWGDQKHEKGSSKKRETRGQISEWNGRWVDLPKMAKYDKGLLN
jgi:hypothetical protein